jgi:hypothetical protein
MVARRSARNRDLSGLAGYEFLDRTTLEIDRLELLRSAATGGACSQFTALPDWAEGLPERLETSPSAVDLARLVGKAARLVAEHG